MPPDNLSHTPYQPRLSLPLVGEGGPLAVDEVLMGMAQDFANHAPEESIRQPLR